MHLWIFYFRSIHHLDRLNNLILSLPVRPFSRLVGKAASTPTSILMCLDRFPSAHWCNFFVLESSSYNNLAFCKILEGSDTLLRVYIWFYVSEFYIGISKVVDGIDVNFRVSYLVCLVGSSRQSPLLSPVSLFKRVSKIIEGTALQPQVVSREVSSLPSGFFVLQQRRFDGISYFLSDGISYITIFPLIL